VEKVRTMSNFGFAESLSEGARNPPIVDDVLSDEVGIWSMVTSLNVSSEGIRISRTSNLKPPSRQRIKDGVDAVVTSFVPTHQTAVVVKPFEILRR
jgi:hypothetical protein